MEIKFVVEKKHLYFFSILLGIFFGILIAYAYNPSGSGGNPSIFGHSVDEVDWKQNIHSAIKVQMGTGDVFAPGRDALFHVVEAPGDTGKPNILSTNNSMDFGVWKDELMQFGDFDGSTWRERMSLDSLDVRIGNGLRIGSSGRIIYTSGSSPGCGTGRFLLRRWSPRTCEGCSSGSGPTSCTTYNGWDGDAPLCTMVCTGDPDSGSLPTAVIQCGANAWTEAFCIG